MYKYKLVTGHMISYPLSDNTDAIFRHINISPNPAGCLIKQYFVLLIIYDFLIQKEFPCPLPESLSNPIECRLNSSK